MPLPLPPPLPVACLLPAHCCACPNCVHPHPQGVESLDGLRLRLVDAQGQVVGRLASQIATILQVRARKGAAAVCPGTSWHCQN